MFIHFNYPSQLESVWFERLVISAHFSKSEHTMSRDPQDSRSGRSRPTSGGDSKGIYSIHFHCSTSHIIVVICNYHLFAVAFNSIQMHFACFYELVALARSTPSPWNSWSFELTFRLERAKAKARVKDPHLLHQRPARWTAPKDVRIALDPT